MPLSQGVFVWQLSKIGVKLYVHMMTEAFVYARIRLGWYELTSVLICQEWIPDVVSWMETFFTRGSLGNCHVDTNEKYISFSTISPIPCKRLKRISWTENVNFVSPPPCKRLEKISWTKNVSFVWSKTGKTVNIARMVSHGNTRRHTSALTWSWQAYLFDRMFMGTVYIHQVNTKYIWVKCTESLRPKHLFALHVRHRGSDTVVI